MELDNTTGEGEIFRQWALRNKLSHKQIADLLGRSDKSSVPQMFKSKKLRKKTLVELRQKLGFVIIGNNYITKHDPVKNELQLSHAGVSEGVPQPSGEMEISSIERVIVQSHTKGIINDYKITGDSMSPTLEDGDFIRCVKVGLNELRNNYVHVITYNNYTKIVVKRLYDRLEEKGHIMLRSDNEDYNKPIYVNEEQINSIHRVLFKLSFNLPKLSNTQERLTKIEMDMEDLKNSVYGD